MTRTELKSIIRNNILESINGFPVDMGKSTKSSSVNEQASMTTSDLDVEFETGNDKLKTENAEMAQSDVTKLIDYSEKLQSLIDVNDNLEDWVKAKLTISCDYVATVRDYLKFYTEEKEKNTPNIEEKWSNSYKKSINCSNAKGFSQKAHCAARRKRQAGGTTSSKSVKEYYKESILEILKQQDSSMAIGALKQLNNDAQELETMIQVNTQLEDWVKARLTLASSNLESVFGYLNHDAKTNSESDVECIGGNNCKCGCNIVNESKIKSYIKKCINEILKEKLVLKRGENDIVVVSDIEDRREAGSETFRHKNALKKAGFKWNSTLNSWTISKDKFGHAQQTLSDINRKTPINGNPLEKLMDVIEELPEFVLNSDNVSKKQELSTKIDEFIEKLSDAVDGSSVSAEVIKFLNFNKHFRTYSFSNTILIYLQNRTATKVAGFNKWKLLHRVVKKGSKAITIFAPITRKDVDDINDAGFDAAVKTKNTVYFRPVSVFDISDTEAIDERGNQPTQPAWHDNNTPSEVADKIYKYASEFAETAGIKLTHDSSNRGEMGWAQSDHINLSSTISGVNKLSTLIHEIAHSLLHFKRSSIFFGDDGTENTTSEQKELQAESVSYVVMRNYDLPVEHQSTYLALWGANKESVKANLQTIKKAANFIIDGIDDVAKEHESKNQLTEILKNLIRSVIRESKSVKKKLTESSFYKKIWFTPTGKSVDAGESHELWIKNNDPKVQIGNTIIDTYENAIKIGYIRGMHNLTYDTLSISNLPNYNFNINTLRRKTKESILDYVMDNNIEIVSDGKGNILDEFSILNMKEGWKDLVASNDTHPPEKPPIMENPDTIVILNNRGKKVKHMWNGKLSLYVFVVYKNEWYLYDVKRQKFSSQNQEFSEMVRNSKSIRTKKTFEGLIRSPSHMDIYKYISAIYKEFDPKRLVWKDIKGNAFYIYERRDVAGRIFEYDGVNIFTFWETNKEIKKYKSNIDAIMSVANITKDKAKFAPDDDETGVFVDYNEYFDINDTVKTPTQISKDKQQADAIKLKQQAHMMAVSGKWKAAMRNLE